VCRKIAWFSGFVFQWEKGGIFSGALFRVQWGERLVAIRTGKTNERVSELRQ
jgi:hypothetical protein